MINFDALVRHGMIAREDLYLFVWVDEPAEALRVLQERIGLVTDVESPAFAKSRTSEAKPSRP